VGSKPTGVSASKLVPGALKEYGGALTPLEAAQVVFRDGKTWLPQTILPCPKGAHFADRRAATFEGRIAAFAQHMPNLQQGSVIMKNLLKAAQRAEIPELLLPEKSTPLGTWLYIMPFAVQFKAAWLWLAVLEKRDVPAYYSWYVDKKCPKNLKPVLASWLKVPTPQQAAQAA